MHGQQNIKKWISCPSVGAHNSQLFSKHVFRENPLTDSHTSVCQIRFVRSPRNAVQLVH